MLVLFMLVLVALALPLARYIARIAQPEPIRGGFVALERILYRAAGVKESTDMPWTRYAVALLLFNTLGALVVYLIQRVQVWLPLNPQNMAIVTSDSAFNTAVSFVTNTNWQGYAGESTMSYFTQMLALAVQNFFSAATGIAVAFALIRGFARRSVQGVGNFWVDATRSILYILLPLSLILAVLFMGQGVIQNFHAYREATTLESVSYASPKLDASGNPLKDAAGNAITEPATTQTQILPMGPVASQEAIKMLGTNGGGFFNANSAHPFENPTPLSNFLQMIAIFLIPAALCFVFGAWSATRAKDGRSSARWPSFLSSWRSSQRGRNNGVIRHLRSSGWIRGTRHCKRAATWRARKRASASSPRRCSPQSPRLPRVGR